MSKNRSKSKEISPVSIFGPPPLLEGEDTAAYEEMLTRVSSAVRPSDFIDKILVRDCVDLTWEIFRWKRVKTNLLASALLTELEDILVPLIRKRSASGEKTESAPKLLSFAPSPPSPERMRASKLVKKWAMGDPAAVERVNKLLSSANVTMDTVMTKAFMGVFDHIERIDRFIAIAEERRNKILREIDRRRSTFANSLRETVQDIDEAEYEIIESKNVTSKSKPTKTAA